MRDHISSSWLFVLFTITIPIALNVIALVVSEINYQVISNYYQLITYFGVIQFNPWPKIILQVVVVFVLLASFGWLATFLIKHKINKINNWPIRYVLAGLILYLSASIYRIGTQIIDFIWVSAFRTGPTFGFPSSSFSRTNSTITFSITLIIFVVYFIYYESRHKRVGQPNPRSTRPL